MTGLARLQRRITARRAQIEASADRLLLKRFDEIQIPKIEAEISSRIGAIRSILRSYPFYSLLTKASVFEESHLQEKVRQGLGIDEFQSSQHLVWQSFIRMVHFTDFERCRLQEDYRNWSHEFPHLVVVNKDNSAFASTASSTAPSTAASTAPPSTTGFESVNNNFNNNSDLPFEKSLDALETQASSLCRLLWEQRYHPVRQILALESSKEDNIINGDEDNNEKSIWNLRNRAQTLAIVSLGYPLGGLFGSALLTRGFTADVDYINTVILPFGVCSAFGMLHLLNGWDRAIKKALSEYKASQVLVLQALKTRYREMVHSHLQSQCYGPYLDPIEKSIQTSVNNNNNNKESK